MALPQRIYAQASPMSLGGVPLFQAADVGPHNVMGFASAPSVVSLATARLKAAGFEILQVSPFTINFSAIPGDLEKAARTKIVEKEFSRPNGGGVTFLDSPDTEMLGLVSTQGTSLGDVIEGIALEAPRDLMRPAAAAPFVNYWHLDVPGDIQQVCNASLLHRLGITGSGVRVAMVDSGWYRHPFFDAQGYNVAPVVLAPGADNADEDESGHGTGESANILAIAPDCQLLPVKANFANTVAAFNAAVALNPDVISCSWGSHSPFVLSAADKVLASSIAMAVALGITVVFSAGNGHAGFPGQSPDVISAGGVFVRPDGTMEASNYASGFLSNIYPGRRVPDLCGAVGMRPKAIYIMLPVQPSAEIDTGNAGVQFPNGDQTTADDGWAAFSGTSAAAPQLAGAAALIKQVAPGITPAGVKAALISSAKDVVEGTCSPVPQMHAGLPAGPGIDDATGAGFVDVYSAAVNAYIDSLAGGMAAPAVESQAVTAYYQGLADAALMGALTYPDPAVAAYLWQVASGSSTMAQICWAAGAC